MTNQIERWRGRVKMFNEKKGYGFITSDDANAKPRELFFHVSEVADEYEPRQNDGCTYVIRKDRNGRLKAAAVMLLKAEAP